MIRHFGWKWSLTGQVSVSLENAEYWLESIWISWEAWTEIWTEVAQFNVCNESLVTWWDVGLKSVKGNYSHKKNKSNRLDFNLIRIKHLTYLLVRMWHRKAEIDWVWQIVGVQ